MGLSKNIFILSLLYILVPIWAFSAELGDDGLHKQSQPVEIPIKSNQ